MEKPFIIHNLDAMLNLQEAAAWLRISQRILQDKTKGRKPAIPAFRIGRKIVRFHPRSIIAKLAKDAGIDPQVCAASMGIESPSKSLS